MLLAPTKRVLGLDRLRLRALIGAKGAARPSIPSKEGRVTLDLHAARPSTAARRGRAEISIIG